MNYKDYNATRAYYKETRTNQKTEIFKSKPITLIIMAVVAILVGIFLIVTQCEEMKNYDNLVEDGYYTYGEVNFSNRNNGRKVKRKNRYSIRGTYTVDNQTYNFYFRNEQRLSNGTSVKIFYEKDNPSNYVYEGDDSASPATGIMCILVGIVVGGAGIKKHRDETNLYLYGG